MSIKPGTIVSEGTLRPEDLIPAFSSFLGRKVGRRSEDGRWLDRLDERMEKKDYYESEDAPLDLEELFDLMNHLAPEGCYFGGSEGDGALFGFWPVVSDLYEP